ncbi:MAG: type IV pilus assembly protein PilM [Elusimicrobia bacterium]|nr:type IV pilus assembly protein PilM [Elusimicrobiota bacterium]
MHSTEAIGIDLGASSIKIVQLSKKKDGKLQVARWSIIPLSTVESEKTEVSPEEKKANATNVLRNYRGSGKKMPKNAILSVSGNSVIVRYVRLPKLTYKELSKTIKQEAEPYIPFNIEEVFLGFHPLGDVIEEGKTKMETVLVAAKKDFVNQRIEILEGAGFKTAVIDVDAFALESVYEMSQEKHPIEETVLIANIGYSKTNFSIIEKGVTLIVKDSPIAGSAINKAVMKNLLADNRSVEKLKAANGLLLTPEEKETAPKEALGVSEAIVTVMKDFVAEAKKIIQYHTTQGKDKKIDRILLSGGTANTKNLCPFLSSEFGLPVDKLNAFAAVSGSEAIPEMNHAHLCVAVGLALRKPGDIQE